MYAKAEQELAAVVSELGAGAEMRMPDTAYYLSCIYAFLGKKGHNTGGSAGSHAGNTRDDDQRVPNQGCF
jgi:hypothetical protein